MSKEGRDENGRGSSNNSVSAGPAIEAIDLPFTSFASFLNSDVSQQYDRFLIIPISHKEGETMINTMRKEIRSNYNVMFNNCGQAVDRSLERVNISNSIRVAPNGQFGDIRAKNNHAYYER